MTWGKAKSGMLSNGGPAYRLLWYIVCATQDSDFTPHSTEGPLEVSRPKENTGLGQGLNPASSDSKSTHVPATEACKTMLLSYDVIMATLGGKNSKRVHVQEISLCKYHLQSGVER